MPFRGFRVARIFGIDIEIDWSLLLIMGLIIWSLATWFPAQSQQFHSWIAWAAALFSAVVFILSVIFHEVAHSLTARILFGINTVRIFLFMFGGIAQTNAEIGFGSAKKEFWIAIMGPISSFFLAGAFAILAFSLPSAIAFHIFSWLSSINLVLAIFNLIPCLPMDGGRVFRAICCWITKDFVKATRIARDTAMFLGIAMIPAAFFISGSVFNALWIAFIVFFMIIPAARLEYLAAIHKKGG